MTFPPLPPELSAEIDAAWQRSAELLEDFDLDLFADGDGRLNGRLQTRDGQVPVAHLTGIEMLELARGALVPTPPTLVA